jgi:hypothetical protein
LNIYNRFNRFESRKRSELYSGLFYFSEFDIFLSMGSNFNRVLPMSKYPRKAS